MRKIPGKNTPAEIAVMLVLPIVCGMLCLCIGRMRVSIADMLRWIAGRQESKQIRTILSSMRLPRILVAGVVGAGLSVSGCLFQSLFANPLATPDTVGVASGASFGAALGILFGFGMTGIQGMSFLMGAAAVALTWIAGKGKDRSLNSVVLSGIMIGSLFSALVSLVKFAAD